MIGDVSSDVIRLFLIDDHALVRQGISMLLSQNPGLEVVGEADDGQDVSARIKAADTDVVVLDLALPGPHGLDVCRQIVGELKDVAVLVLTMHGEEEYVAEALRSGAKGYLLKGAPAEQLAQAIRAVAAGQTYLGPGIAPEILQHIDQRDKDDPYLLLTQRERHVLKLIAQGQSNRCIAQNLRLSVKTVDTHRWRMMRKLDIHDQTTLVKYALRKGLAQLD